MKREYPKRPIVGVGAVIIRGDEILLVRRGQAPRKGEWAIPGGVVELGEKTREAVAREVLEECDIQIEVGEVLEVMDAVIRDKDGRIKYHYVLCDFLAKYKAGHLSPSSDVLDAKWVKFNEVQTLEITKGTQQLLNRVTEMRAIRMA
ncbi:MAG: NUDIX hydrolase [Candidatus Heimdallarchaeota archaeon]